MFTFSHMATLATAVKTYFDHTAEVYVEVTGETDPVLPFINPMAGQMKARDKSKVWHDIPAELQLPSLLDVLLQTPGAVPSELASGPREQLYLALRDVLSGPLSSLCVVSPFATFVEGKPDPKQPRLTRRGTPQYQIALRRPRDPKADEARKARLDRYFSRA